MKKSVNLGSVISFQMTYSVSLVSQPLYFNFPIAKWKWIIPLFLKIRTMGLNTTSPSKHCKDYCFQWITTCSGITGDWDIYCNKQQEGYTFNHIHAAEKDLFSQRQKAVNKFNCTLELDVNYCIHSITVAAIFGRLSHNVTSHDAGGGWGVEMLEFFLVLIC